MKRNKIYELIGRASVVIGLYVGSIAFSCWAFLQRNDLLGGEYGTYKRNIILVDVNIWHSSYNNKAYKKKSHRLFKKNG